MLTIERRRNYYDSVWVKAYFRDNLIEALSLTYFWPEEHQAHDSIFRWTLKKPGNKIGLTVKLRYPYDFIGPLPNTDYFFIEENKIDCDKAIHYDYTLRQAEILRRNNEKV